MTLNTHLLVLFFRLSMSSLRKRKPSWCAVWVGGWGTTGLLWAGADLERRVVVSPPSLGRGRRRGLGLSRARGRSGREDFSGNPLGRRGTSPRAWGRGISKNLAHGVRGKIAKKSLCDFAFNTVGFEYLWSYIHLLVVTQWFLLRHYHSDHSNYS